MRKPLISDILKSISNIQGRHAKIEELRKHRENTVLLTILKYALDPRIEFALPKGNAPYTPLEYVEQQNRIYAEARKFYLFTKDGNPNLSQVKREQIFLDLLESVEPEEAELLIAMKDKKIPYNGITEKLVEEAFPGLIHG